MEKNGFGQIDEFIRNLQLISFLTRHYVEGRFVEDATDKPVSFIHMNLLRILDAHPGKTVGDIAKYMCVSYPAATKTIDKLVRMGFLKRREDSKDRRIAHLHLTTAGKRLVDKYVELKRIQMQPIIDNFGMDRSDALRHEVHAFAETIVETIPIKKGTCMQCGAFDPSDCVATPDEKTCGYIDAYRKKE